MAEGSKERPPASSAEQNLRDLMGLLALPALWAGREGSGVLQLMTQAIERIVELDVSYVNVPLYPHTLPIIGLRVRQREATVEEARAWQPTLDRWHTMPIGARAMRCETPAGMLQVVRMSMGYSASHGSVWFAAADPEFPVVTQLAFLRAAAALAATGLQSARASWERDQLSRAKDEFLAMLGHELRNPLAPITTALELVKRKRNKPFDKYHAIIERQVTHLSRLVEDLLDVSRITRGTIELRRETLRIGSVLARAIEAASPLVEQRRQTLSIDVADGGAQISGDMTRLTQSFGNLLTNAAKYTDVGGKIHVEARAGEGEIRVSVSDNGAGISAELMPRLFSIFEQGRTTIERSEGGLGIGLALVRNLVELHGGTVRAFSEGPGMGAEFVVTLPLAPQAAEPSHAASNPQHIHDDIPHAGVRVLLVDDNADGLASMEAFLLDVGFSVATALDPEQALAIAPGFDPVVVIRDIGPPGMDGYQLAEALRENLKTSSPRFFALSGYGQPGDRQRSALAGFERHFVKPVSLPELVVALSDSSRHPFPQP